MNCTHCNKTKTKLGTKTKDSIFDAISRHPYKLNRLKQPTVVQNKDSITINLTILTFIKRSALNTCSFV